MNVGAWLRKTPQPRFLRVDGDRKIEVGNKGGKWRDLVRTIDALGASKLEALDGAGNIIRALTLDDDDDDDSSKKNSSKPQEHGHCAACGVSLTAFAGLIADAWQQGSRSQRDAYQSIFEENTKLVRLLADRLGALEAAWQRSLQTHARSIVDLAEAKAAAAAVEGDDGNVIGPLVAGFLQSQAAAAAESAVAAPRKPNGKDAR